MPDRILSQEEIDSVFRSQQGSRPGADAAHLAQAYDFRRPDRIAKDQLRSIHLLHDNFARSLASSLSAYLRAYVVVNLVSVEQISFVEFSQELPAPTCIMSLGMKPFDGNAILELNPSIVFPIIEMLLGGSGRSNYKVEREITEIEQSILDGAVRIILHDLEEAWAPITAIKFTAEAQETEPSLLQILAPNEAVVAIAMEIRIGEISGMLNLGIPSIIIKMLRQKFHQQWSVRKSESNDDEQARVMRRLQPAAFTMDARLSGPSVSVGDMLNLKAGDVLAFDYPFGRPVNMFINGKLKFQGQIVAAGRKRGFRLDEATDDQ